MVWADFHIHSTFSDGKLSIPELVDFYGQRGFGAIAITDHLCENQSMIGIAARYLNRTLTRATMPLYLEILKSEAQRAREKYGMVVLPGVEITKNSVSNHRSAHMLAIGVTDYLDPNPDIVQIAHNIRAHGALAIAAHPVSTRKMEKQTFHLWDRREELAGVIDAWEVASGPHWFTEVAESGYPMIASSDLHRPEQIVSWKTVLNCDLNPEAVMMAIRKQEVEFKFYDISRWIDLNQLGRRVQPPSLRRFLSI